MPSCPTSKAALLTFVGATTENPSFEVNSALLSRAAVYVLNRSSDDEMGSCSSAPAARRCPIWSSTTTRARA
jgi:putative ATPase